MDAPTNRPDTMRSQGQKLLDLADGRRLHGRSAQALIAHTYFGLRWGLAGLAFVFPLVLLVGAKLFSGGDPVPTSISGYYHTGMRDYFVGTLVVIGVFLILYKGFSRRESVLLNIAGIATIGAALLPTGRGIGSTNPVDTFTAPQWHGGCAALAFGSVGLVAVLFGSDTLDLLADPTGRRRYRLTYQTLGILMIILPVLGLVLARQGTRALLVVEWIVLWVFVAYWATKTGEFRRTHAETLALAGHLPQPAVATPGPDDGEAPAGGAAPTP